MLGDVILFLCTRCRLCKVWLTTDRHLSRNHVEYLATRHHGVWHADDRLQFDTSPEDCYVVASYAAHVQVE